MVTWGARVAGLLALCACAPPAGGRPHTPHADAVVDPAQVAATAVSVAPPPPLRAPSDRPDVTVYGFWPSWGDPLSTVPWDQLTHVAVFDAQLRADGTLADATWSTHGPTAVGLAAPWGVRVHLAVTSFDAATQAAVLGTPSVRAAAVARIAAAVTAIGADGVNVDVEGLDAAYAADLVSFVDALRAAVGEVVVDVPALDGAGAYAAADLAAVSDGLFLMAYDYHWSGGDPGPVAPLQGGGVWPAWSVADSVDDLRAEGVPDDRIVLGLPLYGRDWPTTSTAVPGTATGRATARLWADAVALGDASGARWDAATTTPYAFPSTARQLWYDDGPSTEAKVAWGLGEGLAGVGFWALTYDDGDPDLWARVDGLTHADRGQAPGTIVVDDDDLANDPAVARFAASPAWAARPHVAGAWGIGDHVAPTEPLSDPADFGLWLDRWTCVDVDVRWTAAPDRATAATWLVVDPGGRELGRASFDQTTGGGAWRRVGTFALGRGWNAVRLSRWAATGRSVSADAVRAVPSAACAPCADGDADGACDVDDACPTLAGDLAGCPLRVTLATPGRAGTRNTWTVVGGTPGASVRLLVGAGVGGTPLPGCGTTPLRQARQVAAATVGPDGHATLTATAPPRVAGRTVATLAWEPATCRTSRIQAQRF